MAKKKIKPQPIQPKQTFPCGKTLYGLFLVPTVITALTMPASAATVWEKAAEILKDVYNQIVLISTVAAVVTAPVAVRGVGEGRRILGGGYGRRGGGGGSSGSNSGGTDSTGAAGFLSGGLAGAVSRQFSSSAVSGVTKQGGNRVASKAFQSSLVKGASAVKTVHRAVKTGKALAGAAKGAAAGGPYGAAAMAIWENRELAIKIVVAAACIIALPFLYILMLPSLVFGGLDSAESPGISAL